jgi:hypothetical protein
MKWMMGIKGSIKKDRNAGIEGLPLQLMIMVVVAGIGTTVILGWMAGLQAPTSIGGVHATPGEIILTDTDGDGVYTAQDFSLTITVTDQSGDGIQGASVLLEGADISRHSTGEKAHSSTDSSGKAIFADLEASLSGTSYGYLTVTVFKSEYGSNDVIQVPVICE